MEGKTETEFTCKCKINTGLIAEGEISDPCPNCGRIYQGVYVKRKSQLIAKQIDRHK